MEPIVFNPGEVDDPEGSDGSEMDLGSALGLKPKRVEKLHAELEKIVKSITKGKYVKVGKMIVEFLKIPKTQAELIYVAMQAGMKMEQFGSIYDPISDDPALGLKEYMEKIMNKNPKTNEN